ncbi:MAG TPA: flagellar motor switch protein FliN [Tepidisphaeraceae bacterium]|jgi:flagellar motor switch protein FliN/FliY
MAEQTPDPAAGATPPPQPAANPTPRAEASSPAESTPAAPSAAAGGSEPVGLDALDQVSIEELLKQANFEDPAAAGGAATPSGGIAAPDAPTFQLPGFHQAMQEAQASSIELLRDVELNVKIELGRSRMLVEDVLKLSEGSVVELDKLAGDPVDVFVNDRLVARGEVLVLNDNFCVRVNEIVAGVKEEGL